MQVLPAVLSLVLPAVAALLACRRIGNWGNRAVNALVGLVIYVLLFLIPIHVIASLQLIGMMSAISLWHIAILDLTLVLMLLIWHHFAPPRPNSEFAGAQDKSFFQSLPKSVIISVIIVGGCYFAFALNLFTSYPQGADGIYYRIPLAVRWLQDGSLRLPPQSWRYALAGNAEIPMMVTLGVGWHPLATFFNLIGTCILVLATYVTAFKSGASHVASVICASILACIPLVIFQSFVAYTEVYGSGLFMAAVAIFLCRYPGPNRFDRNRFLSSIVIAGLACGVAIGTKVAFLIYGAAFFLVVIVTLFVERQRHNSSPISYAMLLAVSMLVTCGFWFGRAFFTTGNPLYPVEIELFGYVFKGYTIEFMRPPAQYKDFVQHPIQWLLYPWTEDNTRHTNYSERGGLGATYAALVPLGLFFAVYTFIRGAEANTLRKILLFVFFAWLVVWFTVLGQVPRYGVPLMALTCILATGLIDLFLRSRAKLFGALLVCSFATTFCVAASSQVLEVLSRVQSGKWTRAEFYDYPATVDEFPHGTTVLNLGRMYLGNFGLSGKRLSNSVIPCFELPFYRTQQGYLDLKELNADFLRDNEVDYIVQKKGDHTDAVTRDDLVDGTPYPQYLEPGIALTLVLDQESEDDNSSWRPWRIWKVEH